MDRILEKKIVTVSDFEDQIEPYRYYLIEEERASGTIEGYMTTIKRFIDFLKGQNIDEPKKENIIAFKADLKSSGLKTTTRNLKIISINQFLKFCERYDLMVKTEKRQRRNTLDDALTENDYIRCMRIAKKINADRGYNVMLTLANTGIRISELEYITVETVKAGHATVYNKGKERVISIPPSLAKELKKYAADNGIASGCIFLSKRGNPLSRQSAFLDMKYIAGQARVKKSRVHPHAFRHLFAKLFMQKNGDIARLKDILGHESIDTTSIYTMFSEKENRKEIDGIAMPSKTDLKVPKKKKKAKKK